MAVLFRAVIGIACIVALSGLAQLGVFRSFDRLLQDMRFALADTAPSGAVVLVEIDSMSLETIGVWPWPRTVYADLLDRLTELGAAEIAIDIDLSSASTPEADAVLAQALERTGGYAYLGAFQQASGVDGAISLSLPHETLLAHADPVLVNVLLDENGLATRLVSGIDTEYGPIIALPHVLAMSDPAASPVIGVDFGIDAGAVPRMSVIDVLEGRIAADRLTDKQVIIGASAIELRDFFQVPRLGIISGPMLQAMGTETVRQGRSLVDVGWMASAMAAMAIGLAMVLARNHWGLRQVGALAVGLALVWELAAFVSYLQGAVLVDTGILHIAVPVLFVGLLGEELSTQLRERLAAQRRLAYLATHDEVTDTLSRTGFVESLSGLGPTGAVVLVNMRRLYQLRGALGQDVVDLVLGDVAARLGAFGAERLAYVQQDVFALGFSGAAPEHLTARIAATVGGTYRVDHHTALVELRFASAEGVNRGNDLLKNAEIALLHGRSAGIEHCRFESGQQSAIAERRQLDVDLRISIATGQLALVFQPQFSLRGRDIVGFEALLRWEHPSLGLVSPAKFIPLAEETGFVVELGRYVLHEACRTAMTWPGGAKIGVNVSPAQMQLSDVVADVRAALSASGLAPERLDIEITEGALVHDAAAVSQTLSELKALGVTISLDDFGTGYSALSYLSALPFDTVKIDQSFVRRLGTSESDDAIVKTIIELCQRLGKDVTAEGIEQECQAKTLAGWGCQTGQGYLFDRPLSAEGALSRLVEKRVAVG